MRETMAAQNISHCNHKLIAIWIALPQSCSRPAIAKAKNKDDEHCNNETDRIKR